jgi:ATP-binding cassette, subfamily B, bacterial
MMWPHQRAGDALAAAAHAAGFEVRPEAVGALPDGAPAEAWLRDAARWLGVEVETVEASYPELPELVRTCAPALVRLDAGLVAVVRRCGRELEAVGPDGVRGRVTVAELVDAIRARARAHAAPEVDAMVAAAAVPAARRERVRAAVLATRLRRFTLGGITLIRRPVEAPLRKHARDLRLHRRLAAIAALHVGGYAMALAAWWALGRTVLSGELDRGWLIAWALLVATGMLARNRAASAAGALAIDATGALRLRLLAGALRLPADLVRGEGVGHSLGRVLEAQALETLAIGGGFGALFATIELALVAVVLGLGAGGLVHVALLALALGAAVAGARGYLRVRRAWTDDRLAITHELIDAMAGHATRLVQQPAGERHADEDRGLARYAQRSAQLDRRLAWLQVGAPRGWLVLASVGLAPALLLGHPTPAALAIALGGMLLAHSALARLGDAGIRLADAAIAWRSVLPLVTAGGDVPVAASPTLAHAPPPSLKPLATLRGITYRPPRATTPVLDGCDLVIDDGDRVVLAGASGAGKSTLAHVIGGLRRPDAGLVLAGGLDRATLGEAGWRRRIALVPQFHDNHIFFGRLAYNVLIGRDWPPTRADREEAAALCRELGLGPTIDRMPGGMSQLIGETGWQLSHGEKSRVYLARALLSRAPLVVLDESLAALDPDTLIGAIRCIERRACAALVIAHP